VLADAGDLGGKSRRRRTWALTEDGRIHRPAMPKITAIWPGMAPQKKKKELAIPCSRPCSVASLRWLKRQKKTYWYRRFTFSRDDGKKSAILEKWARNFPWNR